MLFTPQPAAASVPPQGADGYGLDATPRDDLAGEEPGESSAAATPDVETPDFETPDFETPDFETPDVETRRAPPSHSAVGARDGDSEAG